MRLLLLAPQSVLDVFPICTEKHSELPAAQRKYKGRVVFQGNQVKDQSENWAVFQEMSSSATRMSSSKVLDFCGSSPGNAIEQSDTPGAFTQTEFQGDPT